MTCECPVDGYCERYKREMSGRLRQICAGTVLTPEKCEAYRASWRNLVPVETEQTCAYLGDPTGSKLICGTCKGSARIKVFHCGLHGECTIHKPVGLPTCHGCQHATPRSVAGGMMLRRFDENNLAPGRQGKRFNSSLIEDPTAQHGYILCYRDGWAGSEINLVRMGPDFLPTGNSWRLELRHSRSAYGREDPRLFFHNGRMHVAFVGVVGGRRLHTNVLYARLTEDLRVEQVFYPHLEIRNSWEKNWSMFSHGGQLYGVYALAPHRILKIDGDHAELAYESPTPAPWRGGEMRGGASPVLVGNEWWHFFHDRVEENGLRIYRTGVCTFENKPPFRIRRFLPDPIMVANSATKPEGQYASVVFTCGAVLRDDSWVLSSGIHDRWTELHKFSHAELERRMVTLE